MKRIILVACLMVLLLYGCSNKIKETQINEYEDITNNSYKLIVATDIHYLSPDLIEPGQLFERMMQQGDGKQVNYIDQITDAFLDEVIEQNPDGLILSGDLTFNGEKVSHENMATKLLRVKDAGIPVFVIPGNHDINNYYAYRYTADTLEPVEHITSTEFRDIYGMFGFENAISTDPSSLSYVSELSNELRLIMLDSNKYENNDEETPSVSFGSIREETYLWLEAQLKEANQKNITPIVVVHHNLLEHNRLFSFGYTLNNNSEIIDLLNRYHVQVVLSGHIHIQNIQSRQTEDNTIYDIATSALSVYTNQYGVLEVTPGEQFNYYTQPVDVEAWANKRVIHDENLLRFEQYTYDFFASNGYRKVIDGLTENGLSYDDSDIMANLIAELNPRYFSGTVNIIEQDVLNSEAYQLWQGTDNRMKFYIDSMLQSPLKDENRVSISLIKNKE